ncbi:MAG: glycoside hydrolase family 15 protein [Sinobacteraceae bacterium]|nr:glycoside hydrolase family 15 protein [Nevskiaceae bacterium]
MERWRVARDKLHAAIEKRGMDHARGIFVRSFGSKDVDAALLLLPIAGFVAHDDERMVRTTQVICEELMEDGLLLRYRSQDGLSGSEGVFLACTFWLVSCLARQGRLRQAKRIFARACASANHLGLFAEEYSPREKEMLGNFPQGLTHLSHIGAALALLNKHEQHPPRPRPRRHLTKYSGSGPRP